MTIEESRYYAYLSEMFENVMENGTYSRKKSTQYNLESDVEKIDLGDSISLELTTMRDVNQDHKILEVILKIRRKLSNGDFIFYHPKITNLSVDKVSLSDVKRKRNGDEISFLSWNEIDEIEPVFGPITKVPKSYRYVGNYELKNELKLDLCKYINDPKIIEYFSKNTLVKVPRKTKTCIS